MRSDTTITPSCTAVASDALLDRWTCGDWRDGLRLDDLLALDRLTVRTLNSTYELIVVKPATAEVLIRGGAFFPTFARARLAGASLGGSFLKLRSIHVGFRMEVMVASRSIVTSAVRSVVVDQPPAADEIM
jgi:hypothetical protein